MIYSFSQWPSAMREVPDYISASSCESVSLLQIGFETTSNVGQLWAVSLLFALVLKQGLMSSLIPRT